MAPAMSSWNVVRGMGFTLTLLLVSSAQAVDYELHRHDATPASRNDNVILTSRDFLEQLIFVAPKTSYTSQEATEYLLYFSALLRARILDTFGSLLYDYYDDFTTTEVGALYKVYEEILSRRYDVFNLIPGVLKDPDTRPSRICAEIYNNRAAELCLRSSASVCRRIRRQHDLPHPDDRGTPAFNITYRIYRLSKISKQYPKGFSLAGLLRLLQRRVLTVTPNLLSGLLFNVRYDSYDDDVRLAERELVRHVREIAGTGEIPTGEPSKFHTMNSFLKYYVGDYAERLPMIDDLKRHALLVARRIADVGTIDENIHLLGNVYENRTIHVGYLFDLVLSDDLLENDVIEAKKYLVRKLNEFNIVERYLKVQKYQQATPAQLTMEITGQLRDIDFAGNIAMSLRMHARFWHRSRMIENLDELLELFDTYENLRQVPRYLHMMQKIDEIKESLRDMKDVPVEILCNAPRACLRIGLQLVLRCKFISPQIKDSIKIFLESSNVCADPAYTIQESRCSVEIPFKLLKTRFTASLQTTEPTVGAILRERDESDSGSEEITQSVQVSSESTRAPTRPVISSEESLEFTSTTTAPTLTEKISTTRREETTVTAATTTVMTTTTSPTTVTTLPTTTTALPTTTTTTPETIGTTLPAETTTTELPIVDVNLERSKMEVHVSYADEQVTIPSVASVTTPAPTGSCESNECIGEQSSEETGERVETTTAPPSTSTPTMLTSTLETTRATSSEPSTTRRDFVIRETTVSATTELSETPVTKGGNCAEPCSEGCGSKSESVETSSARRSCGTSCDSVTEDCNGEDSTPKDSPEVGSPECGSGEMDGGCGCASAKEERSSECVTLCPADPTESSSCEGISSDCATPATPPTFGVRLERKRTRGLCEIRDLHHRRQLRRLAKMRAISTAAAVSNRSGMSYRRDRITTKKLYNLLATKLPYSESKRVAKYLRNTKKPLGVKLSGSDRDRRRRRRQRERVYKLRRKAMLQRTRGIVPFRYSQIKRRLPERGEKSISP